MCCRTDGGSVELPKMWTGVQVQTSDGEEARAIGDVHSPKNKAEKRIPPVPVPQRVCGRRRNIAVEQRIYNLIQEEELVSKIPYPGCRICKNGKVCGPCRLVETFKLERNQPKVWHDKYLQGRGPNVGSVAAAPQQTEKIHRVMGRHTVVAAR